MLNLLDAPVLYVDASTGGGMATFSHVGFVQCQSFLQFRMNIVIAVGLLASLVELSPVMCDFRALSFQPSLIDLKTFGRFNKWLDGSHSHMPEPMTTKIKSKVPQTSTIVEKKSRFPSSTFGHVRLVRKQTTINGQQYINPDETILTDVLNNTF